MRYSIARFAGSGLLSILIKPDGDQISGKLVHPARWGLGCSKAQSVLTVSSASDAPMAGGHICPSAQICFGADSALALQNPRLT